MKKLHTLINYIEKQIAHTAPVSLHFKILAALKEIEAELHKRPWRSDSVDDVDTVGGDKSDDAPSV